MIRLHNKTKAQKEKTLKLLINNFEKGNKYLLWKALYRDNNKKEYQFFSEIKGVNKALDEINTTDFKLDQSIKASDNIEYINCSLSAFNMEKFGVWLLTKKEAEPYLKEALILSLTNKPKKVDFS